MHLKYKVLDTTTILPVHRELDKSQDIVTGNACISNETSFKMHSQQTAGYMYRFCWYIPELSLRPVV